MIVYYYYNNILTFTTDDENVSSPRDENLLRVNIKLLVIITLLGINIFTVFKSTRKPLYYYYFRILYTVIFDDC